MVIVAKEPTKIAKHSNIFYDLDIIHKLLICITVFFVAIALVFLQSSQKSHFYI